MSNATPAQPSPSERNLLFAVLALQADLIDERQFVEACTVCAGRKSLLLADLLVERGWITEGDRADVERLAERKLKRHGHDVQASLAAACDAARQSLAVVHGAVTPPEPPAADVGETGPFVAPRRDRYRLNRLHASGGIGRVWVAHDGELGREVALKELRPDRQEHADYAARFVREARITGQLEHPGIVPVYELNQRTADGQPFYVMRFIKGRTLSQAIEQYHRRAAPEASQVEFRSLLNAFVELCNAVAYAHARGVVHRDLKGSNVVLGDFGEVILLDWGLAKLVGQPGEEGAPLSVGPAPLPAETQAGAVFGTPAYMAPEQAAGRTDLVGPHSDVYGLGAILYEILTGRPPYTGTDRNEILRRVLEEAPPRPGRLRPVAAPLEAVCLKALSREPAGRYASARDLAREIESWLADEPVQAWPEPLSVRTGRWARRHKPLLTAAAALLATTCLALAVSTGLILREKGRTEQALVVADRNFQEMKTQRTLAEANANAAEHNSQEMNKQRALAEANAAAAHDQREAAVQARGRAEANLRQACDAVDQMLTRVSQDPDLLAYEPRMEQVRRRLLIDALAFYLHFLEDHGDDRELRAETVRAARRAANILQELGRHDEAAVLYGKAITLCRKLEDDFPTQAAYRQDRAAIHNSLGILYRATGRFNEAEAEYGRAVAIKRQLAASRPDLPIYREELANSLHNQSSLLRELGRLDEALTLNDEALRLWRELSELFPQEPAHKHSLGQGLILLSLLLDDQGNPIDEETVDRQALELQQGLADEYPQVPQYRQTLAATHMNLGILLRKLGRPDEAEKELRRSLELRTKLADDFPGIPAYRHEQARTYGSLAVALVALGRTQDARAEAEKGVILYRRLVHDFRHLPAYRRELTWAQLHYGMTQYVCGERGQAEATWKEAVGGARRLVEENRRVPNYQYDLALVCTALAALRLETKQYDEARFSLDEALTSSREALKLNPGHYPYRTALRQQWQLRLRVLEEQKDHAALASAAEEWSRTDADGPRDTYLAARCLARCAALAGVDDRLTAERRKEVSGRYAGQAVELLRAAVRQGFPDGKQAKQDPAFSPLRDRDDFKALLAELDKGR
jgi:serine/threonine-protein kinase